MSKPFMLTYDLNNPGQRYDDIIKTIKEDLSTGVWCSYWKSSFLFRSNLSTDQMLEKLKPYLDKGDRFFVAEIQNNYQGWLSDKEWEYVKKLIIN